MTTNRAPDPSKAYNDGFDAARDGDGIGFNPHPTGRAYHAWEAGWKDGHASEDDRRSCDTVRETLRDARLPVAA